MKSGNGFKGAWTFLSHSVSGLGTHLNDKKGSTKIRQGSEVSGVNTA